MLDNIVRNGSASYYVASALLLLEPIFKHLLPNYLTLAAFITGAALLVFKTFCPGRVCFPSLGLLPLTGLSAIGVLLTGSLNNDYLVFLFGSIVLSFSSGDTRWVLPFFRTLLIYCLVHVIATLVFFFNPNFCSLVISNTALSNYATARDYRSALSGSYSWNGMYTAVAFILCAANFMLTRRKSMKCVWRFVTLLSACSLVLTTKRAHLMFSIVAFIVMYYAVNREKGIGRIAKFFLLACVALIGFCIVASYFPEFNIVISRFTANSSNSDEFLSGRTGLWEFALERWRSRPVFGYGWGSYRYAWVDGGTPVVSVAAHCVPLQLLAECGIVGLLIALIPFLLIVNRVVSAGKGLNKFDENAKLEILISVGFISFFVLYSFCGNPLYDPPMFVPLFVVIALFGSERFRPYGLRNEL